MFCKVLSSRRRTYATTVTLKEHQIGFPREGREMLANCGRGVVQVPSRSLDGTSRYYRLQNAEALGIQHILHYSLLANDSPYFIACAHVECGPA